MEPQPPPGAPAPPPGGHARRSRKKFRLIVWTPVLCLAVGFLMPFVLKSKKDGPLVRTLGNAKQIGLALQEFEKEYGVFPDAGTVERVREQTGTTLGLGTRTSNDYFRQLLAAGHGDERMFFVARRGMKGPDGILGSRALEKGECGFTYIPGLSSSSPGDAPVLIAPLLPGTDRIDDLRMDSSRVVVLCVDGSVREVVTDKAGHVILHGKRLLDPANPIWNGKPPRLVWPE